MNLLLHTVSIFPRFSDEFSPEQQIGDLPGSETRLMELHLCRKVDSIACFKLCFKLEYFNGFNENTQT